jgi:hypothetical protein
MRAVCSKPGSANPPCALHFISDGASAITPGSAERATDAKDRIAPDTQGKNRFHPHDILPSFVRKVFETFLEWYGR